MKLKQLEKNHKYIIRQFILDGKKRIQDGSDQNMEFLGTESIGGDEYYRFLPEKRYPGYQGLLIVSDLIKFKDDGHGEAFIILEKLSSSEIKRNLIIEDDSDDDEEYFLGKR